MRKYDGRVSVGITLDGDKETHDSCRRDCLGCGSYDKMCIRDSCDIV